MTNLTKKSILVVDDESEVVDFYKDEFENVGFTVYTAFSGNQAVKVVESMNERLDLVLSDLKMEDGDGMELLSFFNSNSPEVPFVLHSGYFMLSEDKILESGARMIIHKPAYIEEILEKVEAILAS